MFLLPILAALGPFAPVIGPFFGHRALVLGFAIVGFLPILRPKANRMAALPLACVWMGFLIAGLFGAQSMMLAQRTALAVTVGLIGVLVCERNARGQGTMARLDAGWVVAFCIVGALGLLEAASGQHYAGYLSNVELARIDTRLVASLFGNPNAFAVFLVLSQPFLVKLSLKAGAANKVIGLTLIAVNLFLVLLSGSRLGLLASILQLGVMMWLLGARYALGAIAALLAALAAAFATGLAESLFPLLPGKVGEFARNLFEGGLSQDQSGVGRLDLYRDGVWLLQQSHGLGYGPGSFQWLLSSTNLPYPTRGVASPHNGFLEIAVEFSMITLAFLLWWLYAATQTFWSQRRLDGPDALRAKLLLAGVAGALPMTLANSSFISGAVPWTWLATVGATAAYLSESSSDASQTGLE